MDIWVVLADDHPTTRRGIRAILEAAPDIAVVGEAKDGVEAKELAAERRPDILLLDLVMPGPRPADIERWVRTNYPETITLILTAHDRDAFLAEMEEAGAAGFLTKAELDESDRDWMARDLEARVRMRVDLSEPETVTLYNVLGLLEGADSALADEMVLISCHYDSLGRAPDGTLYPGANGNASGVAVLLEIARIWQQQGFQPRRTVVFAAWGGGNLRYSGAHGFRDRPGILGSFDFSAVVHLDRLGTPTGDALAVRRLGGGDELYDLLVSSADRLGMGVYEGAGVRHPYQSVFRDEYVGQNGTVLITWGDPQPALADDTVDNISLEHLTQAAEVINLTLITAAHEPAY